MIEPIDPLVVRQATEDDIDGVMVVERDCFGRTWTRAQYLNALMGPTRMTIIVARLDGQVVGAAILDHGGDHGYVPSFGVLSTCRRVGIGSRLLEAMLACAQRHRLESVILEVRESNVAARKLYERYGFECFGVRRGYYTEPYEDGLVMRWTRRGDAVA